MPTQSELEVKKFWERAEPVALTLDRFEVRVYENEKAVVLLKVGIANSNKTSMEELLEIGAEFIDQFFGKQDQYYYQDLSEISQEDMYAIRVLCRPEYITRWKNILKLLKRDYPKYGYPRFRRILDDDPELLDEQRYASAKVSKRFGVYVKLHNNTKSLFNENLGDTPEELLQEEFEKSLSNAFELDKSDSMLSTLLENLEKLPFRVKDRIRYELEKKQKNEISYEFQDERFLLEEDSIQIDEITILRENTAILKSQLNKLSDRQFQVVDLLYFKGVSKTEAGKALQISTARVVQLEKAALKNLETKFSEK